MSKISSLFTLVVLTAVLSVAARSQTVGMNSGRAVALDQESEITHVEKLFSGAHWTHPAPTTWSSRLEVRWNARWENAPQYAV